MLLFSKENKTMNLTMNSTKRQHSSNLDGSLFDSYCSRDKHAQTFV